MSTTTLRRSNFETGPSAGVARLAAEAVALLDAMLNPGRVVREVEQMRALQMQAARIEASDPARAAQLRARAARLPR